MSDDLADDEGLIKSHAYWEVQRQTGGIYSTPTDGNKSRVWFDDSDGGVKVKTSVLAHNGECSQIEQTLTPQRARQLGCKLIAAAKAARGSTMSAEDIKEATA